MFTYEVEQVMMLSSFDQITQDFSQLISDFYEHVSLNTQRYYKRTKTFNYSLEIFEMIIKKVIFKLKPKFEQAKLKFCKIFDEKENVFQLRIKKTGENE